MSVLAEIIERKRRESEALRARSRGSRGPARHRPLDVFGALRRRGPLRLIAEVKPRSPSAGPLSAALPPPARAVAYARGGAVMVSVLCDGPSFGGSWEDLEAARAALDAEALAVPLLAKEFVLDPAQIDEARARGADAVLVIVRVAGGATAALVEHARASGLEPLVEVTTPAELSLARDAGARIIGVNARDLDTLAMDPDRAARVLSSIPPGDVAVHFSGLATPDDVARVAAGRADGALVGEALMRQDDPAPLLARMLRAAGGAGTWPPSRGSP